MKLLVLALCVCSAACATVNTFGTNKFGFVNNRQTQYARTVAVAPAVVPVAPVVGVVKPASTLQAVEVVKHEAVVPVVRGAYGTEHEAPILRSESDVKPDGFNFAYETGNGIAADATGNLKHVENIDVVEVRGAYRYTSPDGTPVVVNYVADENGYQPQSDLLPVGPPIPAAIARSLEWIAAHPPHQDAVEVVRKF